MRLTRLLLVLPALFAVAVTGRDEAEPAAPSVLEFWTGEWEVFLPTGERIGMNRIEKILEGHAVLEHWRDREGREGKSLFYYQAAERRWKQVWVSDDGTTKEKSAVSAPEGAVRFLGRQRAAEGKRQWLDRTTLTPGAGGTVEQLIEISVDEGENWRPVFTGIYRRSSSSSQNLPMNKINWFQIPAADLPRATKFYADVLGWQFHQQENQMGRHAFVAADPGSVTGELVQAPYAKPSADGPRLFLSAPGGVAAALSRVEPAGGKVAMPVTPIGPYGVIAVFIDSEGNQVGLHGKE